jgi:hypothetical protein
MWILYITGQVYKSVCLYFVCYVGVWINDKLPTVPQDSSTQQLQKHALQLALQSLLIKKIVTKYAYSVKMLLQTTQQGMQYITA